MTRHWQHERIGQVVPATTSFREQGFAEHPDWREVEVIPLDAEPTDAEIEAAATAFEETWDAGLATCDPETTTEDEYIRRTMRAALVAAAQARRAER